MNGVEDLEDKNFVTVTMMHKFMDKKDYIFRLNQLWSKTSEAIGEAEEQLEVVETEFSELDAIPENEEERNSLGSDIKYCNDEIDCLNNLTEALEDVYEFYKD